MHSCLQAIVKMVFWFHKKELFKIETDSQMSLFVCWTYVLLHPLPISCNLLPTDLNSSDDDDWPTGVEEPLWGLLSDIQQFAEIMK